MPWQVLSIQHRSNETQHELVFKATVNKIANFYIRVLPAPKNAKRPTLKRFEKVHSIKQKLSKTQPTADDEETDEFTVQNSVSNRKSFNLHGTGHQNETI